MVPEGPPARANPAKGIALIATALILGLFILRQGFDTVGEEPPADGAAAEEESAGEEPTEAPEAGGGDGTVPPEEEEPMLGPSELTVRVVNTTSVVGTASDWTCFLGSQYGTLEPTNAAGERDQQATTVVLHRPELDREGAQLAQIIGEGVVSEPVPDDPPLDSDGQPLMGEGTHLLVMLGTDRAGAAEPCPQG